LAQFDEELGQWVLTSQALSIGIKQKITETNTAIEKLNTNYTK